jgi:DNA-binding transcriptional ArsR family regulator
MEKLYKLVFNMEKEKSQLNKILNTERHKLYLETCREILDILDSKKMSTFEVFGILETLKNIINKQVMDLEK